MRKAVGNSAVASGVTSTGEDSSVGDNAGEGASVGKDETDVAVCDSVTVGSGIVVSVEAGIGVEVKVAVAVEVGVSLTRLTVGVISWARDIAVPIDNNPTRTIFTKNRNFHLWLF